MKKKIIISLIILGTIPATFFVYQTTDRSNKLRTSLHWLEEKQYVPSLGLYRDSPVAKPFTVWIMNDNLLTLLLQLDVNLTGYEQYLSVGLPIEILLYKISIPPPFNGSTNITVEIKDGYTIKTEIPSGELMKDWNEYADLLTYGIMLYHYSGDQELATEYFQELSNMWDGRGFVDRPFADDSEYQTYKNALFIIVAKTLGYKGSLVCEVNNAIWRCYKKGGGFYTGYLDDGSTPSDTNTETTCLVLLAHKWKTVEAIKSHA